MQYRYVTQLDLLIRGAVLVNVVQIKMFVYAGEMGMQTNKEISIAVYWIVFLSIKKWNMRYFLESVSLEQGCAIPLSLLCLIHLTLCSDVSTCISDPRSILRVLLYGASVVFFSSCSEVRNYLTNHRDKLWHCWA